MDLIFQIKNKNLENIFQKL